MQNFYCDLFFHKLRMCKDWCTEFSKSNFGVGVEEFLFKRIISFAKEHVEKKWRKKNTAKKELIVSVFPETEDHISSWRSLSMPSENLWKPLVFDIFRWLETEHWSEMG